MVFRMIKQGTRTESKATIKIELQLPLNGASCAMRAACPHTPAFERPSRPLRPDTIRVRLNNTANTLR